MEHDASTHPDEGTIHAWLDDALNGPTAASVAAHVHGCADCASRVAEARGLIAGSARIVAALDDVPAGARPAWAQAAPESSAAPVPSIRDSEGSLWRWLRVTPARAAIAATLIVAIGITLTRQRVNEDTPQAMKQSAAVAELGSDSRATGGPASDSGAAAIPSPATRVRDQLLDSAVARNLATTQPPRSVGAATSPAMPEAPPVLSSPSALADPSAAGKVALGRRLALAQRDSVVGMDRAPARTPTSTAVAGSVASDGSGNSFATSEAIRKDASGVQMTPIVGNTVAKECYVIGSSMPSATWGDQALPLIVAVEPGIAAAERVARLFSFDGAPLPIDARWTRGTTDSVVIRLRRVGYAGVISLGAGTGERRGVATDGPAAAFLSPAAVASVRVRGASSAERTADERKTSAPAAAAPAPSAARPTSAPTPARTFPVTARRTGCPAG